MELIRWTKDYSVGNLVLDAQHHKLIRIINKLITNADPLDFETISELLSDLVEYMNLHCKTEEAYIEKIAYPDLESHKQEHRKLKLNISEFCLKVMHHDHTVLDEIRDFLTNWWIQHVLQTDMQYKDFHEAVLQETGVLEESG